MPCPPSTNRNNSSRSSSLADDKSGTTLAERLTAAGHHLAAREIIVDDVEAIRVIIRRWVADPSVDVIVTTGGTGFTRRDVTPEAVEPLFEKRMDGFSIAFHMLSYAKIGTSTVQSRATAGVAGGRCRCNLHLLPAGIAGRLPRRLGRHSLGPARLPHAPLQLRRDHAAARRTSAAPEGARGFGVASAQTTMIRLRSKVRERPSCRSSLASERRAFGA